MKMITSNISESVLKDAKSVADGTYAMNARYSTGYAFCCDKEKASVAVGEHLYASMRSDAKRMNAENFDGYIDFERQTLIDFHSGEVVKINTSSEGKCND